MKCTGILAPLTGDGWSRYLYGYDVQAEVRKAIDAKLEGNVKGTD